MVSLFLVFLLFLGTYLYWVGFFFTKLWIIGSAILFALIGINIGSEIFTTNHHIIFKIITTGLTLVVCVIVWILVASAIL